MRLSRKQAHRGQQVEVTFRDGSTATGTLLAWGTSLIRVQDREHGWTERATAVISKVEAE